jgi:hypothetical protein
MCGGIIMTQILLEAFVVCGILFPHESCTKVIRNGIEGDIVNITCELENSFSQ